MINDLFEDCNSIAEKYGQDVADVVTQFTIIELSYRTHNVPHDYKLLIDRTNEHFVNLYGGSFNGKEKEKH